MKITDNRFIERNIITNELKIDKKFKKTNNSSGPKIKKWFNKLFSSSSNVKNKNDVAFLNKNENKSLQSAYKLIPKSKWINSPVGKKIAKDIIQMSQTKIHMTKVLPNILKKHPDIYKENGFIEFALDFLCTAPGTVTVMTIDKKIEDYWGIDKCRQLFAKRGLFYHASDFSKSKNIEHLIQLVRNTDPDDYGYRLSNSFKYFDITNVGYEGIKSLFSVMGKRDSSGVITEPHQTSAFLELLKRNISESKFNEIIFRLPPVRLGKTQMSFSEYYQENMKAELFPGDGGLRYPDKVLSSTAFLNNSMKQAEVLEHLRWMRKDPTIQNPENPMFGKNKPRGLKITDDAVADYNGAQKGRHYFGFYLGQNTHEKPKVSLITANLSRQRPSALVGNDKTYNPENLLNILNAATENGKFPLDFLHLQMHSDGQDMGPLNKNDIPNLEKYIKKGAPVFLEICKGAISENNKLGNIKDLKKELKTKNIDHMGEAFFKASNENNPVFTTLEDSGIGSLGFKVSNDNKITNVRISPLFGRGKQYIKISGEGRKLVRNVKRN